MKGLSSILKSFLIFCLLRGWQRSDAVPEYVLYLYENISISGGALKHHRPLSRCLQTCNAEPTCEAVDWDERCWFHYSSSSCNGLRFGSNVRHYQMKRCPDNPAYNCPCSTGGTCVRTYTSLTQISSQECVCNLGRAGDQCSGYVECSAPTFPNAVPSSTTEVYIFGSTVTYTCNSGYQLRDGSSSRFTLTCGPRGEFEGERKACTRTCAPPVGDHLRHVTPRSVTFEGQSVTFTCDTGFQFNDTSTVKNLTCQSDGTFDQGLLSCVPILCGFPTDKFNLKAVPVESPYNYTQNVTFSCIPGYHFAGYDVDVPFTSQCIATNALEPSIPDCIKRTCTLPHLNNTVTTSDGANLFFMTSIEFKCIKGFQLPDGNTTVTLTCDKTGGFGVDTLSCTAVLPGTGIQAASTNPNIGGGVGVGVTGAIVLILLIVIVVVFVKRKWKRMSNSNEDFVDVSGNGKLSNAMYTTSNTHFDTNLYELDGECPIADRNDQSNNMRQTSNNENQASDVQDLYAVPDKSKKSKKGKNQQNTPVSYPDDAYEYVSKPSAQASSVSRQDRSSTYELAGQFQNGGYAQSIDDADDVEFVENDIYETGGVDNMGHTCVESVENDIYNSSV